MLASDASAIIEHTKALALEQRALPVTSDDPAEGRRVLARG